MFVRPIGWSFSENFDQWFHVLSQAICFRFSLQLLKKVNTRKKLHQGQLQLNFQESFQLNFKLICKQLIQEGHYSIEDRILVQIGIQLGRVTNEVSCYSLLCQFLMSNPYGNSFMMTACIYIKKILEFRKKLCLLFNVCVKIQIIWSVNKCQSIQI